MKNLKDAKRIVVKVGTSTLTYETGNLNYRPVENLVRVLCDLKNSGKEIILVSSGAIGVGFGKMGVTERPTDIPSKQAAAAVGQCELMYRYDKLFAEFNHTVAQVLLTKDVIDNKILKENVINTFNKLFEYKTVPIVNENDTVSVDEIELGGKFGDNDTLSAIVASLVDADLLIILSDIDGFFDKDPNKFDDAKLIKQIKEIDENVICAAGGVTSKRGTGGMATKIAAAKIAFENNIDMIIMNGKNPKAMYDIFDGNIIGTLFSKKD
ncbi:MAG: glutamate 5-kinase [Clostridia bacterium]